MSTCCPRIPRPEEALDGFGGSWTCSEGGGEAAWVCVGLIDMAKSDHKSCDFAFGRTTCSVFHSLKGLEDM